MVKLAETNNVLIGRQLNFGQEAYLEVPAIGDGNCAFNAFALGLIDLMQRDQLNSNNDKKNLNDLIAVIKSQLVTLIARQKLYANKKSNIIGNPYEDIADELNAFIQFMQNHCQDADDLIAYVKTQNTREGIAAVHVGFAPALRHLGVDLYVDALRALGAEEVLLTDANNLKNDGEVAGQDALPQLAKKFDLNLQTKVDTKDNPYVIREEGQPSSRPSISLVHVPGHYNYAFPQSQQNGLAQSLAGQHAEYDSTRLVDDLILSSEEHQKQIEARNRSRKLMSKKQIMEVTNLVKLQADTVLANEVAEQDKPDVYASITAVAEAIKANITQNSSDGEQAYQASVEAVLARQTASSTASTTPYINDVKALLFKGVTPSESKSASDDEILARALQNAEILDFLAENYDELTAPRAAQQAESRPSYRK